MQLAIIVFAVIYGLIYLISAFFPTISSVLLPILIIVCLWSIIRKINESIYMFNQKNSKKR